MVGEGTINTPHLRKPKKARQQAAHNIVLVESPGLFPNTPLIFPITSTVTGSRVHL